MKTLWTASVTSTASAFALCFALLTPTWAQQSATTGADPTANKSEDQAISATSRSAGDKSAASTTEPAAKVKVASAAEKDQTDKKLSGREVKGSDGKELGNVKDFLINPIAGRVEYAVISTGGVAGIGDKLRLVPIRSLHLADAAKEFSVAIDRDRWDEIAPLPADAYKGDTMTMTESERRQVLSHFAPAKTAESSPTSVDASPTMSLVKASDLDGKDVRSAGQEIGKIDSVVIDPVHGTAQALFDPKRDFAGTTEKFVVPLNQFTLAGGRLPAETLLDRGVFDRATGNDQISSSSSGTLPVASNATTQDAQRDRGTNTDRNAQIAAGPAQSAQDHGQTTVAAANTSPSMTGRATQPRETEPGKSNSNAIVGDSNDPGLQQGTPPADSSATANARTDRADTNGVNPAAVAANPGANPNPATVNPEAAARADAKSPTSSPPFRREQGQDIASTVPASPSSKAPGTDKSMNSPVTDSTSPSSSATTAPNTGTQSSAGLAANSTPPRTSTTEKAPGTNSSTPDQSLTPTGRTSADQAPGADPALNSAALAVRRALDDNPSLARLNVAVTPENGKVVLRGSVASAQLKTATEDTARRAADNKTIDSQLTIEGQ